MGNRAAQMAPNPPNWGRARPSGGDTFAIATSGAFDFFFFGVYFVL